LRTVAGLRSAKRVTAAFAGQCSRFPSRQQVIDYLQTYATRFHWIFVCRSRISMRQKV